MGETVDDRAYCRLCRTFSAPGDRCGNCHRRRDGQDDELDAVVARSLRDAQVVHRTSRLRAGASTFGPAGRIGWSVPPLLWLAVVVTVAVRTRNSPWIALLLVAVVATSVVVAFVLRELWKRDRVD